MTETSPQKFDFRNAGTSDQVVRMLKDWIVKSGRSFSELWESIADPSGELACSSVLSRTFAEGVSVLDDESIGWIIQLGEEQVPTLASLSYQDLIAIVGCVVGAESVPADGAHRLTMIEISLCQMIFETIASSLSESWTGPEPLTATIGEIEDSPSLSRIWPASELMLATRLQVCVGETTATVTWLLPRKKLVSIFEGASGKSLRRPVYQTHESLKRVPVEVVGLVGQVKLPMRELNRLKAGDLIVLDQKIDEPVLLSVDNRPLFRGWPGRLGEQQGIEIVSLV